jgi:proteic killer suppression protein
LIFSFKNKHLLNLYQTGKSGKYKLQKSIIKKFFMRVQQIEAANDIYDLWKNPALNFEKLEGYDNKYSIKLNIQYRLELEIDWENEQKTIGKIYIVELSPHYAKH